MAISVSEELKAEILAELGYNDQSPQSEKDRVAVYIRNGIYALNKIAGAEINFDDDRNARSLLASYCRYCNSYVIEEFEENFQDDLLRLYLEHRVKEVGANGED